MWCSWTQGWGLVYNYWIDRVFTSLHIRLGVEVGVGVGVSVELDIEDDLISELSEGVEEPT